MSKRQLAHQAAVLRQCLTTDGGHRAWIAGITTDAVMRRSAAFTNAVTTWSTSPLTEDNQHELAPLRVENLTLDRDVVTTDTFGSPTLSEPNAGAPSTAPDSVASRSSGSQAPRSTGSPSTSVPVPLALPLAGPVLDSIFQ